jgi:hypothetical protein
MQPYDLFINFKKAYDSIRKEILYNILTKPGIPMQAVNEPLKAWF